MSPDESCEVPNVDDHGGSVKIVLDDGGNILAMCGLCRKNTPYERIIDENPDRMMTDGGREADYSEVDA